MSIEQEIRSNFLTRFKAKIKPTTMIQLEMHAHLKEPAFAFEFVLEVEKSAAAKAIRDAAEEKLPVDVKFDCDRENVMAYRLAKVDVGGDLIKESDFMFGREFYPLLFEELKQQWKTNHRRVGLIGNSGTGKSWFQMYALRRLMLDFDPVEAEGSYSFVVRQVGEELYVYDLEKANVFYWAVSSNHVVTTTTEGLSRALYFFEPDTRNTISPMPLQHTPSLSTLSQCLDRIKEYKKRCYCELYFPAWTLGECVTVGAKCDRTEDAIRTRYQKFGGVLRHVLTEDVTQAETDLNDRLIAADIQLLHVLNANIDRDADISKCADNSVSGFLLCYSQIPEVSSGGKRRFRERSQDFTSEHVSEEIRKKVRMIPITEKADLVLKHLNHEKVDRSGASLEGATANLLSLGSKVTWLQSPPLSASYIEEVNWNPHSTRKRSIEKVGNDIYSQLVSKNKILAPTNVSFPVSDLVLSCDTADDDISTYQATWQETHAFSLEALYKLRVVQLRIGHDRKLVINFVVPQKEETYAKRGKLSYLVGNPNADLKVLKTCTIARVDVASMWENTEIRVVKPQLSWEEVVTKLI
jgi:hypothetical protein